MPKHEKGNKKEKKKNSKKSKGTSGIDLQSKKRIKKKDEKGNSKRPYGTNHGGVGLHEGGMAGKHRRDGSKSKKPSIKKIRIKSHIKGKTANTNSKNARTNDGGSDELKNRKKSKKDQKNNLKTKKGKKKRKKIVISKAEKKIRNKRKYLKFKVKKFKEAYKRAFEFASAKKIVKNGVLIPDFSRKIFLKLPSDKKRGKKGIHPVSKLIKIISKRISILNTEIRYYEDFLIFKYKRKIKRFTDYEQVEKEEPQEGVFRIALHSIAVGGWWSVQYNLYNIILKLRENIRIAKNLDIKHFDGIDMDADLDEYLQKITDYAVSMDNSEDYFYLIINFKNSEFEGRIARGGSYDEEEVKRLAESSKTLDVFINELKNNKKK